MRHCSKGHPCALWIAISLLAASGMACGTSQAPRESSTASSSDAEATAGPTAEARPSDPAESAPGVSATASESEVGAPTATAGPLASERSQPAPAPLSAATRRTGAGLPDDLRGYQTWFRLPSGAITEAHPPMRQAYVDSPQHRTAAPGNRLTPPLALGTRIVLEAKSPSADFIESLSSMTKTEEGWQYAHFHRTSGDRPFDSADVSTCGGCHSKAEASDAVFSKLVLQ